MVTKPRYPGLGYLGASSTIHWMKARARDRERLWELLREMRYEAGFKQVDLAARLGRPQSFVSKYETGERRLEVLELREICRVCGTSITAFARRLERSLASPLAAETRSSYRGGRGPRKGKAKVKAKAKGRPRRARSR